MMSTDDNHHTDRMRVGLSDEELKRYQNDGYLVLKDILRSHEIDGMLCETQQLLASFEIHSHPLTKFSTGDKSEHVGDAYFLESGDKIRFFFEEEAFDQSTGLLVKEKERAINKIGHNLHGLSKPFRDATLNTRTRAIARNLGFEDPRVLQSMVICKQPEIGGAVPPHQDSTFLYTDPPSAVGFWFALEDATIQNGCLSFAPGSHRRTPIKQRFVRVDPNDLDKGTEFVKVEGAQWPRETEIETEIKSGSEHYRIEEVKAGDLVIIHGNVMHKSERNMSSKGRIIYTFHMIEGNEKYDNRNWLQIPNGNSGFDTIYLK